MMVCSIFLHRRQHHQLLSGIGHLPLADGHLHHSAGERCLEGVLRHAGSCRLYALLATQPAGFLEHEGVPIQASVQGVGDLHHAGAPSLRALAQEQQGWPDPRKRHAALLAGGKAKDPACAIALWAAVRSTCRPHQSLSLARRTCSACALASEYTATVQIPIAAPVCSPS
jgi:hypothetical protein